MEADKQFEAAFQRAKGNRLQINTYGMAWLYYNGAKIATNTEPIQFAIGTPDFKFNISVPDTHRY